MLLPSDTRAAVIPVTSLILQLIYDCKISIGLCAIEEAYHSVHYEERVVDFYCNEVVCTSVGRMSLLTRLRGATEAEKIHDAASISENKENLDPRVKIMNEIQAMLDGFTTDLVDSGGAPASDGQDDLAARLKREWRGWFQYSSFLPSSQWRYLPRVPSANPSEKMTSAPGAAFCTPTPSTASMPLPKLSRSESRPLPRRSSAWPTK
ncbi:hypothetical protein IMZ48_40900 [Candidatus Bathyarchaeota archaeon]|nr:hypothetical protein [Candidatus Bathyarchaeota archaeon]